MGWALQVFVYLYAYSLANDKTNLLPGLVP